MMTGLRSSVYFSRTWIVSPTVAGFLWKSVM